MDFRDTINRVNGLTLQVTDKLGSIAPLATRIVIGLGLPFRPAAASSGTSRTSIGFFQGIGIPFPAFNAGLVASMETVGGIMLILGLFHQVLCQRSVDHHGGRPDRPPTRRTFLASWGSAAESSPTDIAAFRLSSLSCCG